MGSSLRSNLLTLVPLSSKPIRHTYYSTYEDEDETPAKEDRQKRIMILGGGPNRIGQGIEFDYCCCHASFALREIGNRVGDGQFESGDGQYRLRHQRLAILSSL